MSKRAKQLLILLSLVIFAQLLSSPFHSIGNFIYTSIRDQLSKAEFHIESKEARYSFPNKLSIPYTQAKYKNYKSFSIQNLSLSLSLKDLLILKKKINTFFNISNSEIDIDLVQPIFNSNKVALNPRIKDLDIKKILNEIKINAYGKLSIKGDLNIPLINKLLDKLNSSFKIFLKIREGHYINGIENHYSFLTLPEIKDIKLDAELKKKKEIIDIADITLSSSIGLITGSAKINFGKHFNSPETISTHLNIDFTNDGANFFNQYLRIISKESVSENQKKWTLIISKNKNQLFPEITAKPL